MKKKVLIKIMATLILVATIVSSCDEERRDSSMNAADFFKIEVTTEDFGKDMVNTRSVPISGDTVITPLEDGLIAETVILEGGSAPTRAKANDSAVEGAYKVVGYHKSGNVLKKLDGFLTFDLRDGTVINVKNNWHVEPGDYTFVCIYKINGLDETGETGFATLGTKSMVSDPVRIQINGGDPTCKLQFMMRHKTARFAVEINSEVGDFAGLKAKFEGRKLPEKQKINFLRKTEESPTGNNGTITRENFFDVMYKTQAYGGTNTEDVEVHLIGGGASYAPANGASLVLTIQSGTAGGHNLAGKAITFSNIGALNNNDYYFAKIKIKQTAPTPMYSVTFAAETGGSITNSGRHEGTNNTTFISTATADAGHAFAGWYDSTNTLVANDYTISRTVSPTENGKTYYAHFDSFSTKERELVRWPFDHSGDGPVSGCPTIDEIRKIVAQGFYYDPNGPVWKDHLGYEHTDAFWIAARNNVSWGADQGVYHGEVTEMIKNSGKWVRYSATSIYHGNTARLQLCSSNTAWEAGQGYRACYLKIDQEGRCRLGFVNSGTDDYWLTGGGQGFGWHRWSW